MRSTGVVKMGVWRQPNTGIQRFPRKTATVAVRISTVDPETDPSTGKLFFRSAEETTANLSRGGAYVRSWEPLEAGRRLVVDVQLPDARRLQLVARVAWTQRQLRSSRPGELDSTGYGVEFGDASRSELARLECYLDSLESRDESTRPIDAATPSLLA
jgi:Tfp pilus assembly protein PilZ